MKKKHEIVKMVAGEGPHRKVILRENVGAPEARWIHLPYYTRLPIVLSVAVLFFVIAQKWPRTYRPSLN